MSIQTLKDPFYFVGMGGTGMAPLAELCLASGKKVCGSDLVRNKSLTRLVGLGATLYETHDQNNVAQAKTVIYSSAIARDNPELVYAREHNLEILHRSDLLAQLLKDKNAITVAGTHGKTTTSALITHMLASLGVDPIAAVGGRMIDLDSSARVGQGPWFVAEADESDGSLVKFKPHIAVLTNIDHDHLDFHGGLTGLYQTFSTYLGNLCEDGTAVVGWDSKPVRDLCSDLDIAKLSYGSIIGCDVRLLNANFRDSVFDCDVIVEHDRVAFKLPMIGIHNVHNALAALAVARVLELDIGRAAESLATYKGVARRLSLSFDNNDVKIFDDYAHNPGKIAACVKGVKQAFPTRKLIVIFQPHRFTRLQTMFDEFCTSFNSADEVIVLPTYAAGEKENPLYTADYVAEGIAKGSQQKAKAVADFASCVTAVCESISGKTIVLTVGAGDVWQVSPLIQKALSK